MKKKLKIQFWKAECALAMQILEQEGLPERKDEGNVQIISNPYLYPTGIYLRGEEHKSKLDVALRKFVLNSERDIYLNKIVNAITEELFTGTDALKVGEICEVSNGPSGPWHKRKLIAILPSNYYDRFIAQSDCNENDWYRYKYARPIYKRVEPKIEECGDVITYTWDEE